MRFTAAAVQFEPRFGDKAHNLSQLLRLVEEAATAGARLIVLPEMATTGYRFQSRAEVAPLAEEVPGGPTTEAFAAQAARLGLYVVVGLVEVEPETGAYYNCAALIGPEGFVGKYRKLHAYIDETRWAKDGDLGLPVFDTALGRLAIQICMDCDYPEVARLAAVAGADVLIFPNNWIGDLTPWYARAVENGLYVISANRWNEERGTRFAGSSSIIDPDGHALNLLSRGDGLCLAEIDLEKARTARTRALAYRRPEAYQELLIHTHLWRSQDAFQLPNGRQVVVATGRVTEPAQMADQARWADRQARDKGLPGLDLMLFPYSASATAEEVLERLGPVARDLSCYIAWGGPDAAGGESAWLLEPEGLMGSYRAIHPQSGEGPAEPAFALFDLAWGRVGLATGLDLTVPETARILAKRGADLIIAPLQTGGEAERILWNCRWLENDTAVAVATPRGESGIFGARPKAQPGLDGVLFGVVDTASERIRAKEALRKVQPFWYGALVRDGR